jgi:uncharacterized protein (TIGR00251 family)
MSKDYNLHDGKKGTALAIHVIPRAQKNEMVEIQRDGTIKIRLNAAPEGDELNQELVAFLTEVLGVPAGSVEVVAGVEGRSKLVSVLNIGSHEVQERILSKLA